MNLVFKAFAGLLALLALTGAALGADSVPGGNTVEDRLKAIDPLDEHAGDFIDTDFRPYAKIAHESMLSGDYERAAQAYLYMLKFNVDAEYTLFNLASCYALMDDAYLAGLYLERAARAGFDDVNLVLTEPDFDNVRGNPVFDYAVGIIKAQQAQSAGTLGDLLFVETMGLYPCRVVLPEGYDPKEGRTLVLGLHGWGSNPDWFANMWLGFDDPDFIYAALQAPYAFEQEGLVGYSWYRILNHEDLPFETRGLTVQYVLKAIETLRAEYKIDRVVLFGFSQGAILSYVVGLKHPDAVDALCCFAGVVDTAWITEDDIAGAAGLPVFIANGTDDRSISLQDAYATRDLLEDNGYAVEFMEYAGGHGLSVEALSAMARWVDSLD